MTINFPADLTRTTQWGAQGKVGSTLKNILALKLLFIVINLDLLIRLYDVGNMCELN